MTGPEQSGGEGAGTPPPRRHRRAVGPPGAPPATTEGPAPVLAPEPDLPEDDDERLLRDVPPHHGG